MKVLRFLLVHWAGAATSLILVLVGIVIAQNLEPVQVDVLFWSFPALPKLVLILVSMLLGALLAWVSRLLLGSRPAAARTPVPRPE
jgi:uncharacterized integral membrane protein